MRTIHLDIPLLLNHTRIFSSLLLDLTNFSILPLISGTAKLSTASMMVSPSTNVSKAKLAVEPPTSVTICLITALLSGPIRDFNKL